MDSNNLEDLKEITLKDLENYEAFGMRCTEDYNYQDIFKNEHGRSLDPDKDMVCIGEYGDFMFGTDDEWTKFKLIGDDIGDGWFYFFLWRDKIYLDKDNLLLDEKYHDLVSTTLDQFFGPSISHTIDFRGNKE